MTKKHSITLTSAPVAAALTERDPQARELVAGPVIWPCCPYCSKPLTQVDSGRWECENDYCPEMADV